MRRRTQKGQAILEYILLVAMIAVTIAVTVRGSNIFIFQFWTGLARIVQMPCPDCNAPAAPTLP